MGDDNTATVTEHLFNGVSINKNGYLYVYVSNETPNINVPACRQAGSLIISGNACAGSDTGGDALLSVRVDDGGDKFKSVSVWRPRKQD